MAFSVLDIWKLRQQLDEIIIKKEYGKIADVKTRFSELVRGQERTCRAFICYNYAFWNDREKESHIFANITSIFNNIKSYEEKYCNGGAVSTKMKHSQITMYLAAEVWILRQMFDKFVLTANIKELDVRDVEQNMILGKAILDRAVTLANMDQNESFRRELIEIVKEVRTGYEKAYGKNSPKTEYYQMLGDYVEK